MHLRDVTRGAKPPERLTEVGERRLRELKPALLELRRAAAGVGAMRRLGQWPYRHPIPWRPAG